MAFVIRIFILSSSLLVLLCTIATPVQALPVSSSMTGTVQMDGGTLPNRISVNISGPESLLGRYTIGLYNISAMTAVPGDPDYQVQALQADQVTLLREYGTAGPTTFDLTLDGSCEVGVFLIRQATLRDFSLGLSPYRPIFSSLGAPGSHLLSAGNPAGDNTTIFSLLGSAGQGGVMMGGMGLFSLPTGLTITITNEGPDEWVDNGQPVVPEPGTIALFGLGLTLAGLARRRTRTSRV